MEFDYSEYLRVSIELSKRENIASDQAFLRVIVNRAYYSTYGSLRKRIATEVENCFKKRGFHNELQQSCFIAGVDENVRLLGISLQKLSMLRNRADYQWEKQANIKPTEASTAIKTAEDLIPKIKSLSVGQLKVMHDDIVKHQH